MSRCTAIYSSFWACCWSGPSSRISIFTSPNGADGQTAASRPIKQNNMFNPFNSNSNLYPVRWFLVLIAALTMSMSFVDYTGYRFLGYTGNQSRNGYYGSHYY